MNKESFSAVLMTFIIALFSLLLGELSDEASLFPTLLLVMMCIFNCGQYILAWAHRGIGGGFSLKGYPLGRVAVLAGLTLVYISTLQTVGFYPGSVVFFVAATLIAQPDKITAKTLAVRIAGCTGFVVALYMLFTVLLTVQIPKGFLGF